MLVLTEPESEFADNASTSKENFESFVNLLTNTVIKLSTFKAQGSKKAYLYGR